MKVLASISDLIITSENKRHMRGAEALGFVIMRPEDFLRLTTHDMEQYKEFLRGEYKEVKEYKDTIKNIRDRKVSLPPFLDIRESGQIFGHEGRHRAASLINANKKRFPVFIKMYYNGSGRLARNHDTQKMYGKEVIPTTWYGQTNKKPYDATQALKTFVSLWNR